ncbi:hypothetical protein CK203_044866 [Vitis vinifera]|uniref:Uncharacterized protein n=1 Tax=Vitis vinifera TaxID=29760 RepID=A0A438H0C0_VITVI|nr:hypothetical protein CK203_044866 [Vitis vinifera]
MVLHSPSVFFPHLVTLCLSPIHLVVHIGQSPLDAFLFVLQCPYGGLLGSSVEFTSFHSLFTLTFHSIVHVPYTHGTGRTWLGEEDTKRRRREKEEKKREIGRGGFFSGGRGQGTEE